MPSLARYVVKHAVVVIVLWIIALGMSIPYAGLLGGKVKYTEHRFLPEGSESLKASELLDKFSKLFEKIGMFLVAKYIVVVDNINTSDPRTSDKYFKLKDELESEDMVKGILSYYDILKNITDNVRDSLNETFTKIYDNITKFKETIIKVNESYVKAHDMIMNIYGYMPKVVEGIKYLDKAYLNTYEAFKNMSESLSNVDDVAQILDAAFNQSYMLTQICNLSLGAVSAIDRAYTEIRSHMSDLANAMYFIKIGLRGFDESYSEIYGLLSNKYSELREVRQQLIQLNGMIYSTEEWYRKEYFNILRIHYYLNATGIYDELVMTPENVSYIQSVTDTEDACSLPPVDSITTYLVYSYVKIYFNNSDTVREEDLLRLATTKIISELRLANVPQPYSSLIERYVTHLENSWKVLIRDLRSEGKLTPFKMLTYDPMNIKVTKWSQCLTYTFLSNHSSEVINYTIPYLAYDIANYMGLTPEEAYATTYAAYEIGYPPTETSVNHVLEEFVAKYLESYYGGNVSVNWGYVAHELIWKGPSPELAQYVVKSFMKEYMVIPTELPYDMNISKEEIIDLISDAVVKYDSSAKATLTYNQDILRLATLEVFKELLNEAEIPGNVSVGEYLDDESLTKIYSYTNTYEDTLLDEVALRITKAVVAEYAPDYIDQGLLDDLIEEVVSKSPLSPNEKIDIVKGLVINIAFSYGFNIEGIDEYLEKAIIRLMGYEECDGKCLNEVSWSILQELFYDLVKGGEVPKFLEPYLSLSNIGELSKSEYLSELLKNKDFMNKIKNLYVTYGPNALTTHMNYLNELITDEIVNYLLSKSPGLDEREAEYVVKYLMIGKENYVLDATKLVLDSLMPKQGRALWEFIKNYDPGCSEDREVLRDIVINYLNELITNMTSNMTSELGIELSEDTVNKLVNDLYDAYVNNVSSHELKGKVKELFKEIVAKELSENETFSNITISEAEIRELINQLPMSVEDVNEFILTKSMEYVNRLGYSGFKEFEEVIDINYVLRRIIEADNESKVINDLVNEFTDDINNIIINRYLGALRDALISNTSFLIIFDPKADDEDIKKIVESYYPYADVYLTGSEPIGDAMARRGRSDLAVVDKISTFLVLLAMIGVVGSFIALTLPLTSFGIAFVMASAVVYLFISRITDIHMWARALLITTTLGLGVDYSSYYLLMLKEELGNGVHGKEAAINALSKAAPAIVAAASTDAAGFGVLALAWDFPFMKSLGLVIPVGVLIVMTASLTLVPAVTSFLCGKKWFWWPRLPKKVIDISKIGLKIVKNAKFIILAFAIITVISGIIYAQGFSPSHEFKLFLPEGEEAIEGFNIMKTKLSSSIMYPVFIVLNLSELSDDSIEAIEELIQYLEMKGHALTIYGPTRPQGIPLTNLTLDYVLNTDGGLFISDDRKYALLQVFLKYSADSEEASKAVREIKEAVKEFVRKSRYVNEAYVGGLTAEFIELDEALQNRFWTRVFPAALVAMFILMTLSLRSLPAGILSTALVSSSALIGLAVTIVLFREMLNVSTIWFLPMVVFAVLMGVGMDYFSFYFVKARYELASNKDPDIALAKATKTIGILNLGLATIVSAAYGSLMVSTMWVLKEIGFALSLSIFTIALATAYITLPAAMKLLKKYLVKSK